MDKTRFTQILKSESRDYSNRQLLVNTVLQHPDWVLILLKNMKDVNKKGSDFSARILELICKKKLNLILPYLDVFSDLIPKLKLDGSIRASAKIIELLSVKYFIYKNLYFINKLNPQYLEQFTESCFDWMITDKAIAVQAHSMYSLYLLGNKYDWIHPELIQIINKNLPNGSTGYKNRGKKIIKAIQTKSILKLY